MALTTKLKAFLKKSKTAWKDAAKTAKESGGYKNLDDGFYTAKFKTWMIQEGKDEDSPPQDVRVYVISEGEHEGFQQRSWQRMDPETNPRVFEFLANDMLKLDPDLDVENLDWDNLDKVLGGLVKDEPEVVIKLSTSASGYQNTRLWRLANPDEDLDEDEDEDDELDEDEEDEEDEDEDEESDEIDVNSRVTFELKGTEYAGVVTQFIDDDTVKVKCDSDGKVRRVAVDDLELEESDEDEDEEDEDEDEDEEREVSVGDTVEYAYGDETFTGEVLAVNEDEGKIQVKSTVAGKVKKRWIEAEGVVLVEDDDDEDDEEEEEPEPEPAPRRTRRK